LHLRKIEIKGFKSFMNPLELEFSSGITAILGPNGCGKSNVVDAIRWVLGEQRTRLLRNTKMENVLFNGTRLRKPLGMAEVFLSLSNEDHGLSVDYEEVTIGRRLFRSGASDYLLNGDSTRLKSIKSLLVDTGLGNNAYAIIERDMIDKVLSEKEQDKRNLLEEAAGVMRYRIQREEAERKIKLTEQDLLRLNDVIQELDKELRSLKYQMAKARRYQRLREKADAMETTLLKASLFELLERRTVLEKEREEHENIRLADDNEISRRENSLQELKINASQHEHRLQGLHETRYDVSSRLQRHEEKIAVHTERIESSKNRIVEDEGEIVRAREKLTVLAADLDGHRMTKAAKNERLEELRGDLHGKEQTLAEVSRRLESARGALREKKQLALDLVREKAKERGLREHLEQSLDALTEKRSDIETQLGTLSEEEMSRVAELTRVEDQAAAAEDEVNRAAAELNRLTDELEALGQEAAARDDEYSDAARLVAKLSEKKEFLERIKQEHSKWSDEALGRHEGLQAVLSDLVRVDRKYRKVFEACLSPILSSVVATSREDALSSLESLRASDSGRVQILYPDRFATGNQSLSGEGVVGPAMSLVECDKRVRPFLDDYLADVTVVEDTETAVRILSDDGTARLVTLDGVFFNGPGRIVVTGGADIEMTILEYDAKLEELTAALADALRREGDLERAKANLTEKRHEVQRRIGELRSSAQGKRKRLDALALSRRETELTVVRIKEKITALQGALAETEQSMAEAKQRLASADGHEAPDGFADDAGNVDLAELESRVHGLEREKESLAEAAGLLRLENVSLAGEVETIETKIRNAEKLEEELRQLIQAREEDARRCREQIELSGEDTASSKQAIAELHAEKDRIEKDIETTTEAYEEVKERGAALEKELKQMKDQRDAKRENLERVSVEMATLKTRVEALVEKAEENFDQDLRPYLDEPSRFDPAEWQNLDRTEMAELRSKVDNFGPVNMLALDEYNEKKERFDFLCKQNQDLLEAKNSLSQAIRRINREARRLLSETFEKVRENFKHTFLTLFDGGEVDLLWADSDDPLEANIKIVANPKGKKLHDISSLSSGERALVALSLLFGIYLVKPSPFCVFDEVDAPLDDANIARFVRLLQSFTAHTQFIVITHNKKTMEAADNLYGVTMEEPGVSKLVSIHLDEAERFRRHQPPVHTAGPDTSAAGISA
jgi:chromosome segregation protein